MADKTDQNDPHKEECVADKKNARWDLVNVIPVGLVEERTVWNTLVLHTCVECQKS